MKIDLNVIDIYIVKSMYRVKPVSVNYDQEDE